MKKLLLSMWAITIVALTWVACDDKDDPQPKTEPETIEVTSIAITPGSDISITVGETVTLSATILPDNATNKKVTWESQHPDIATVNEGVVAGVEAGTAVIRVTAADGSGKYAEKSITVNPEDIPDTETTAEFDNSNFGLYKGILVGSSGTVKIELNNGNNVAKAYITIDNRTDELTSTDTFTNGVAIDNATFTGAFSTFTFSVDSDGENPVISDIQIEGHEDVLVAVLKQTSTNVASAHEGTTVGGNNHTGVLNFIRNDNTYFGISRGSDGITFSFRGDINNDGSVSGTSQTTYMGLKVTLTYSGKFDSNSNISGTWTTSWDGGTNGGTFSGKKTL